MAAGNSYDVAVIGGGTAGTVSVGKVNMDKLRALLLKHGALVPEARPPAAAGLYD